MGEDTARQALMRSVLERIATGPEYSKDVSREDARTATEMVLDGTADPVQAGIFLIALRMKRETDEEYLGVLDAVRGATVAATAAVDDVLDVADPYDGFSRSLPASPFLPAVLAACGVATFTHGLDRVGPKHGLTHRRVLTAAGAEVDLGVEEAAARLADPAAGWSYVDQRAFSPALHGLVDLRERIVKRPTLTTVEVLGRPLRGRARTHLFTGFVHRAYPRVYLMLARAAGFSSALAVRGVEGGVVPSLRQSAAVHRYLDTGPDEETRVAPGDLGIDADLRAPPLPAAGDGPDDAAAAAAAAGLAALDGKPGPTREALVYAGALALAHLGRAPDLAAAAAVVREALDSGAARARFAGR